MKCLYLAEDYVHTKVHHNLCSALSSLDDLQLTLFSLQRQQGLAIGIPEPENCTYHPVVVPFTGNRTAYKYLFPYKTTVKTKLLLNHVEIQEYNFVLAATLFSEGTVALELFKKFKIPYAVIVRGSDLNFYFKKMYHLRKKGKDILRYAKKVIFITPTLQKNTLSLPCLASLKSDIEKKSVVIPNGIDPYWLEHCRIPRNGKTPRNILYIGHFDNNKNVLRLIEAVKLLRERFPEINLNLVGAHGEQEAQVLTQVGKNPDWLHYHGEIREREKLASLFRSNDLFAMVSHSETFGLVYIEALTQGLPIVYTAGQGFDGQFPEGTVGFKTSSTDTSEIVKALENTLLNYQKLEQNLSEISFEKYDWKHIAEIYDKELFH